MQLMISDLMAHGASKFVKMSKKPPENPEEERSFGDEDFPLLMGPSVELIQLKSTP